MPPSTNSNATHANRYTTAQFTFTYPTEGCGFLVEKGKCKYCKKFEKAWNITSQYKPHLDVYKAFRAWEKANGTDFESAKLKQPYVADFVPRTDGSAEELFAMAICTLIANFSLFNTPE